MRRPTLIPIPLLGFLLFTNPANAQLAFPYPVPPATKLESFDTNVTVVILKAATDVGSISGNTGVVAVKCKEITDTSTGHKEQGLGLEITLKGQPKDTMLIDYDEIAPLVSAIDYIAKLDVTSTPLNSFDAAYTTKGGFRIAALGTRNTGLVQFGVRDARTGSTPVVFSREEMARLAAMINQAKATLDSLRG